MTDQISQVDLFGPGVIGLFAEGVLTGLVVSQFSMFLDHVGRDSRGLLALAMFVTVAALFQSSTFIAATWRNHVLHEYNLTWIENTQPIFTSFMAAPVQAYLIWRCSPILARGRWIVWTLVLLLALSVAGRITAIVKIYEAEYHGTLLETNGSARFRGYPVFISAVLLPAILDIEHIRRRVMRLIVIG
ncbi:hypothetical protein EDB85DRAFT_1057647 [Lactarius pseudohatsudake]|nr:hypothetical protein EDB85DRAFT_1057647 [Lactarius pseudohatsudake]